MGELTKMVEIEVLGVKAEMRKISLVNVLNRKGKSKKK